jgi:hypothetical protein
VPRDSQFDPHPFEMQIEGLIMGAGDACCQLQGLDVCALRSQAITGSCSWRRAGFDCFTLDLLWCDLCADRAL